MKSKACIVVVVAMSLASAALGHCDWINGPVVASARAALEKGDLTPVLHWVPPQAEAEVRDAFARTLAARGGGAAAREVADRWFFETVVRLHRASEGEAFTGIKGAEYKPEPGIELADHAIESASLEEAEAALTAGVRAELRKRFAAAMEAKKHAGESVEAGRRYVHAYAEFIHYADALQRGGGVEH